MIQIIFIGLLLLTTSPSSQPTTAPSIDESRDRVRQAQDSLRSSEAACLASEHASPEYATAKAALDAATKAAVDVRNGTPDERLQAAGKRTKAALAVKLLETTSLDADPAVATDRAELASANAELASIQASAAKAASPPAPPAGNPDSLAGQVSKGMTYNQVVAAIGRPVHEITDQDGVTGEWIRLWPTQTVRTADGVGQLGGGLRERLTVRFEDDKVVSFQHSK